jgi:hypothetical protein
VQEWRTQFTRIRDDLIDVLLSRSVVEKLRAVVVANPRLQFLNLLLERILQRSCNPKAGTARKRHSDPMNPRRVRALHGTIVTRRSSDRELLEVGPISGVAEAKAA